MRWARLSALCVACLVVGCTVDTPIAAIGTTDAAADATPADSAIRDAAPGDSAPPDAGMPDADAAPPDAIVPFDCTVEEITPIEVCARDECSLAGSGATLTTCLLARCSVSLLGASDACRECLEDSSGGTIDEIRMRCAPP